MTMKMEFTKKIEYKFYKFDIVCNLHLTSELTSVLTLLTAKQETNTHLFFNWIQIWR